MLPPPLRFPSHITKIFIRNILELPWSHTTSQCHQPTSFVSTYWWIDWDTVCLRFSLFTFLLQTLWEGPVPVVSTVGAAGARIRLGNEGAASEAPVDRSQDHRTSGGRGCSAGSSSGLPVHLPAAGGVQRPLSSCTHHQQLPTHPGQFTFGVARFVKTCCVGCPPGGIQLKMCSIQSYRFKALKSDMS